MLKKEKLSTSLHCHQFAQDFLKNFLVKIVFTRDSSYCFQWVLASAILSVCLSVCLSHGWISQKRCKLESPNLHHRLPGRL